MDNYNKQKLNILLKALINLKNLVDNNYKDIELLQGFVDENNTNFFLQYIADFEEKDIEVDLDIISNTLDHNLINEISSILESLFSLKTKNF